MKGDLVEGVVDFGSGGQRCDRRPRPSWCLVHPVRIETCRGAGGGRSQAEPGGSPTDLSAGVAQGWTETLGPPSGTAGDLSPEHGEFFAEHEQLDLVGAYRRPHATTSSGRRRSAQYIKDITMRTILMYRPRSPQVSSPGFRHGIERSALRTGTRPCASCAAPPAAASASARAAC